MVVVKRWIANKLGLPLMYVEDEYSYYPRFGRKILNVYYCKIEGTMILMGPGGKTDSYRKWLPLNKKAEDYFGGKVEEENSEIVDKQLWGQLIYSNALGHVIFWMWVMFSLFLMAGHVRW